MDLGYRSHTLLFCNMERSGLLYFYRVQGRITNENSAFFMMHEQHGPVRS